MDFMRTSMKASLQHRSFNEMCGIASPCKYDKVSYGYLEYFLRGAFMGQEKNTIWFGFLHSPRMWLEAVSVCGIIIGFLAKLHEALAGSIFLFGLLLVITSFLGRDFDNVDLRPLYRILFAIGGCSFILISFLSFGE